jgi:hypothetical protein
MTPTRGGAQARGGSGAVRDEHHRRGGVDVGQCEWGGAVPRLELAIVVILFAGIIASIAGYPLARACAVSRRTVLIASGAVLLFRSC